MKSETHQGPPIDADSSSLVQCARHDVEYVVGIGHAEEGREGTQVALRGSKYARLEDCIRNVGHMLEAVVCLLAVVRWGPERLGR